MPHFCNLIVSSMGEFFRRYNIAIHIETFVNIWSKLLLSIY